MDGTGQRVRRPAAVGVRAAEQGRMRKLRDELKDGSVVVRTHGGKKTDPAVFEEFVRAFHAEAINVFDGPLRAVLASLIVRDPGSFVVLLGRGIRKGRRDRRMTTVDGFREIDGAY